MLHCVSLFAFVLTGASMELGKLSRASEDTDSDNAVRMARNVDRQNGLDAGAVEALLTEARGVIIAARNALF